MIYLRLLFTLFAFAATVFAQGDEPLCKKCNCVHQLNSTIEVNCVDQDVYHYLFDEHVWMNFDTNTTYNYSKVEIHNNNLGQLAEVFLPTNMTYFDLTDNHISHIEPGVFANLQSMQVLILSKNRIQNLDENTFKGQYLAGEYMPLRALRVLKLDHNELHTLNQDLFDHTVHLTHLDLSDNPFKTIDVSTNVALTSLLELKTLVMREVQISWLPDTLLHTLKNLQTLDLSRNPIAVMPETFQYADNLQNLYLNSTAFKNLTEQNGFPLMKSLKVLHVCHNSDLVNVTKHALGGLVSLEELHLCENVALNYIDPMALVNHNEGGGGAMYPPIKKLFLQNNKLPYIEAEMISRWDDLRDLDIKGNPWTCDCENQWMLTVLIETYLKVNPFEAKETKCGAPVEMQEYTLYELYEKQSHMRCLDMYGARPEKDAMLLVGVLAGVLICLPVILFLMYAYQRRWFGLFSSSAAAYSRQYYSRTTSKMNDDF